MNPVQFRKLMRIAVIVIAVAFLYSFFGWYLLFTSSKENKRLAEIINLTDNQHALGQRIANTSLLLLLSSSLTQEASASTHQKLSTAIALFEKGQASLLQKLNENDHPHFIALDFGVCKDEKGNIVPKLIELQGFPSLYGFQVKLAETFREVFDISGDWTPYFNGLNTDQYLELLKEKALALSKLYGDKYGKYEPDLNTGSS